MVPPKMGWAIGKGPGDVRKRLATHNRAGQREYGGICGICGICGARGEQMPHRRNGAAGSARPGKAVAVRFDFLYHYFWRLVMCNGAQSLAAESPVARRREVGGF